VTGRSQFIMIPPEQDAELGTQAMTQVRESAPVLSEGVYVDRVARIGRRIAAVSDAPNLPWEFIVIDEPVLNAWALPGGKVAIYSKMLESFSSDQELAAVVGHEIAHAVLRHGAEQLSRAQAQQLVVVAVATGVGAATDSETDSETAQLAAGLGSLAAQGFVSLPHGRAMELEADDIGTLYMARAGYDPRGAVRLWQRMRQLKEGQGAPPTFLSTHPSDDNRIARINEKMPTYLAEYNRARR